MLKLINVTKDYKVADTVVRALKGVSLCFRQNEFVSILGPSGCGKTTMLNIIGGLDNATSGDLQILSRSTKDFKDRDWDVYRNHRIGFIFQSYNLIAHQTVLGNVELALTIAGMSKAERVAKAKAALDRVGLSDQYNKRPNQLSGGQCQRVAIARALVNDPEILLADEPTGALDTTTSVQIMDLIREIAKERLVIMVTHNPELAEEYSTRIIKLLDGNLVSDSNPYSEKQEAKDTAKILALKAKEEEAEEANLTKAERKKRKKKRESAKMSFWTAFKLSVQNLLTKKKRTILTSVAGSIGIIGVSLVLAMSYGIQGYINNMQNDMLSGNPIEITETAFDVSNFMSGMSNSDQISFARENGWVNVDSMVESLYERMSNMSDMRKQNTITPEYVQFVKDMPDEYLSALFLDYQLDLANNIYTDFKIAETGAPINISLTGIRSTYGSILEQIKEFSKYASLISSVAPAFSQMPDAQDYILSQYTLVDGNLAANKNEIVIVLGTDRSINDLLLAQLGFYSQEEFLNIVYKVTEDDNFNEDLYREKISYEDLVGKTFVWYPNNSIYEKNVGGALTEVDRDGEGVLWTPDFVYDPYYEGNDGFELSIVGILEPQKGLEYGSLEAGFYYTTEFAEWVIEQNKDSELVQFVKAFLNDEANQKKGITSFTSMAMDLTVPIYGCDVMWSGILFDYEYFWNDTWNSQSGVVGTSNSMMSMLGMFGISVSGAEDLLASGSLTLQALGGNVDEDGTPLPGRIAIYPLNLSQKKQVLSYLDRWNADGDIELSTGVILTKDMREEITYSDLLSIIMSMINMMVQIVTIALVGFTSLALIVSCVMISIITYVSVVERVKEIGVIRSLGGRKRDVSNLFIAETFIIGLASGLIGVLVTYILSGIINLIVGSLGVVAIAVFPWWYAVIMVSVSVLLTLISGVSPSRSAAKKDPVVALRTE